MSGTQQYRCVLLVWYEQHPDLPSGRYREKQIKGWRRASKLELIETMNPSWEDLFERIAHG